MLRVTLTRRPLRLLDFDIETKKVGFFEAGPFSPGGCEPTAIAASWVGEEKVHVWLLPQHERVEMLEGFRALFDQADIVTGHYVKRFDLPVLNGAMFENRLPLLGAKLVSDTKADLRKMAGLSKSQENLGEMLRLAEGKFHMNDARWRKATRLEPEGVSLASRRATSDVRQHKLLRSALVAAGALRPARMWTP